MGLVTAAGLAAIGHHVLCVDVDERKIASLTSGEVPFFEPGLPEMIARGVASQHLRFTSSVNLAIDHGQVIIIGVGTPPLSSGAADLSQVLSVATSIGNQIQNRAVVVVKSTVPVGTSELVHDAIRDELIRRGDSVAFSVASNPEFLKEVNIPVGDFIFRKAEVHLQSVSAQTNFILRYNLTGSFGNLLPHYLRPEIYIKVKENINKLVIKEGYAEEAIKEYGAFNYMNLSNIFEYMNNELFSQTANQLIEGLLPNGLMCYWNLMVPRRISAIFPEQMTFQKELSNTLSESDNGFFYSKCIIDQKNG